MLNRADSLMRAGKTAALKRGRPSLSVDDAHRAKAARGPTAPLPITAVRTDSFGHWPMYSEKKGRCKLPGCKGIPKVKCEKCQVYLCFTTTSNCFREFHL